MKVTLDLVVSRRRDFRVRMWIFKRMVLALPGRGMEAQKWRAGGVPRAVLSGKVCIGSLEEQSLPWTGGARSLCLLVGGL